MAQGDFPDDSREAEKARYRQKLAEWKAMGFDVSALEVLLETDLEKFKEKRFELMKKQIHGAGTAHDAPHPEGPPRPAAPVQPAHPPAPGPPEQPRPDAFRRRPGLHSHFAQLSRPPAQPGEPSEPAAPHEHLHSEMRYPSARRRRPERQPRTFSVAVEHDRRPRGIHVGEGLRPVPAASGPAVTKKSKAAPSSTSSVQPRRRPAPPDEERPVIEIEADGAPGPDEEPEMAVEEEGGPEGPSPRVVDEEHIAVVEEGAEEEAAPGEEEPDEEEPEEEEGPPPSLGFFTPASRVPMKRPERPVRRMAGAAGAPEAGGTGGTGAPPARVKKVRKVAAGQGPSPKRKPPYGWMAVAIVITLIVAGLAGYYYLAPRTTLAARADFPSTAEAGALVTFDGGNSTTTGKGIARYDWSFGDETRGTGRRVTHYYPDAGTFTVSLTVEDQDGTRSAPYKSVITVAPLSVAVPAKRIDDTAGYAVNGTADISNKDTYLYTVTVAGQPVTVSEVQLNVTGTMTQWVRDQVTEKDGYGLNHSAIFTTSKEDLLLFGKAFTNGYPVVLNGALKYDEDSYADAASGGVFQVRSFARTTLSLPLQIAATNLNSTDTLRAYPGVGGVLSQFQPEDIYRGKTFDQAGDGGSGTYRSGEVDYCWSRMGVQNIGGYPSLGLNITAGKAYLDKNGFSEFFINVWISNLASMPTSTLVHVVGRSGDTTFSTDHLTVMTDFKAGSGAIDFTPQTFDPSPLPPELFYSPFVDVVASGPGNASLRFSPEQAVQEASARDGSFRDFLSNNPQSYACAGKYYEGQFGPGSATWNLTFSWPNATSSYWVNVTRDLLQQYTVHGGYAGGLSQVKTSEGAFARMLSLSSAEGRMRSDPETASVFFQNGAVNWAGGTSLELSSDAMYPSINLASLFASPEKAGYAAVLSKGADTSAFSADTGQMMYFHTHASS